MTGRVGADLDELQVLRRVLGRRADEVEDAAATIGWHLDRYRAVAAQDAVPLPPHRARSAALAGRLDALGRRVARSHEGLVAADRWVGTAAALWAVERKGQADAAGDVVELARVARQGRTGDLRASPWLRGASARAVVAESAADLRQVFGGPSPAGTGPVAGTSGRAVAGGLAGRLAGHADRFWASRAGAVTRLGGRTLGVAGLALGAVDTVDALRAGDDERAWTSGLGTAAGAAMLSGIPPLQLVGAVVSAGLLLHAYRDELADGVRAVGRGISAAADAATGFLADGLF